MTPAAVQNRPAAVPPEGLVTREGLPVCVAVAYAQARACARSQSPAGIARIIELLNEATE